MPNYDLYYVRIWTPDCGYEFVGNVAEDGSPTLVLVDDFPTAFSYDRAEEIADWIRIQWGFRVSILRKED